MTDIVSLDAFAEPAKRSPRPGWAEIVVGLIGMVIFGYGGGAAIHALDLGRVTEGLIFTALTGIAGLAAFAAAALLRLRLWSALGVRPVSRRWLVVGILVGLAAFVNKGLAAFAFMALTGITSTPQDIYAAGGSGGAMSLVLATLFLTLLSPLGEEFLYRGVAANALRKYGWFAGVVGSTAIFALMHGINIVLPAAMVAGLATAELFRRSGFVWPGFAAHAVMNLPTIPVLVLADAAKSAPAT